MSRLSRHIKSLFVGISVLVGGTEPVTGLQQLTAAPCPTLPIAASIDTLVVRCALVTVPQTRGADPAPELVPVQLRVVIFARRETPSDATPVLFLTGGPGESAIDDVAANFLDTPTGRLLIRQRRIIAFDQRGFDSRDRQATPWLGGLQRAEADTTPLHIDQLFPLLRSVSTSLRSRGVDLRNFNTIEAANDAVDVLRVLGIQRAILFGSSYGTRVAFHIVKLHGDMVEAAILDGVVPPQATAAFHLDSANAFRRRAVKRLVDDCAEDERCHALYPHLWKDWSRLARLGSTMPVSIKDRSTGQAAPALVRGDDLLAALGGFLIFEEFRVAAPAVLSELASAPLSADGRGGIVPAALRLGSGITTIPSYGLGYLSVVCADAPMGIPQYGGEAVCQALGVPFGGRLHVEAVRTRVPMLLLAARYDASSPPEWADLAARSLPAARVVHIPGTGHVSHGQPHSRECVAILVRTFVADPATGPDRRCADSLGLPPFPVPAARGSIPDNLDGGES